MLRLRSVIKQAAERQTEVEMKNIYGVMTESGNVAILYSDSGEEVTRIDANVYPVDSDLSARYEHPGGIILTVEDAKSLSIVIE